MLLASKPSLNFSVSLCHCWCRGNGFGHCCNISSTFVVGAATAQRLSWTPTMAQKSGTGYTLYTKGIDYFTLVATIEGGNVTRTRLERGWITQERDRQGNKIIKHVYPEKAAKDNTSVGRHPSGNGGGF